MRSHVGDTVVYLKKEIQLIIWDCDGVLVDSERLASRAFYNILAELGANITEDYVYTNLKGGTIHHAVDFVHQHVKVPCSLNLAEYYRKISFDLFTRELLPVEGVMKIVRALRIVQCIASNGPLIKINHNLRVTGLSEYFGVHTIFSGHQIQKYKPDPALFLHAARSLHIAPEKCLVIEDSSVGAQAAYLANMRCLGFSAETDPFEFMEYNAMPFYNMHDLYLLFEAIEVVREA